MEKEKRKVNYPAALIGLVVLIVAGSYVVYTLYVPQGNFIRNQSLDFQPTPNIPVLTQAVSPVGASVSGLTQDPGPVCNLSTVGSRILVPINTTAPIRDPMPGIRYSLNENQSGRTIVLDKGEMVEINLRWIPSLNLRWIIPVSGCGLELVNDGYYDTGTDFWNTSGHYRARYRAVSPGTSILDGKFVTLPTDNPKGAPRFNLTVIVK